MNFLDSVFGDDGCSVEGTITRNPVSQLLDRVLDSHIGLAGQDSGLANSQTSAVRFLSSSSGDVSQLATDQVVVYTPFYSVLFRSV
jgi:hypothetical protein